MSGGGVFVDGLVAHVEGELLGAVFERGGAVGGDVVHDLVAVGACAAEE